MPTLAQTLATTTPVSTLLRKARRLGLPDVNSLIALAAERGCSHYGTATTGSPDHPSREQLADDELTILLLIGENPYEPMAVRCAAQLARSRGVAPSRLARLAIMEKCERVLTHIARAGIAHDLEGAAFWHDLLEKLPSVPLRPEPDLPHWTRFVSMPGRQRNGVAPSRWLTPSP